MARFMRTDLGRGHSRLRPPVVVQSAAAFVARPIDVTYADVGDRAAHNQRQRRPLTRLEPPAVVGAGVVFAPINGTLTPLTIPEPLRRAPHYALRRPVVVTTAETFVAAPVEVRLARSSARRYVWAGIRGPKVIGDAITFDGPFVHLAPSSRGIAKSKLGESAAAAAPSDVFAGPSVSLASARRRLPTGSVLRKPTVIDLSPQVYTIAATLVRIKHRPVLYTLRKPTDTIGLEDQGRVATHLTYSRRGQPSSRLAPPTVIDLTPQVFYLRVETVRIKHPPVQSVLRKPADTVGPEDQGRVATHLTYSRRGIPKPRLFPPALIDLSPQVRYLSVTTTYSRRGQPKSVLRRPADTVGIEDQGKVVVHLAPSRRGIPRYRLAPPALIDLTPQTVYLSVTTAPGRAGHPKSRLAPPAVVAAAAFAVTTERVTLVQITPPRTRSRLAPPALIDLSPQVFYLATSTVRIRPVPVRTILGRPADTVGLEDQGRVAVHLTYSRRGTPKPRLGEPAVINLSPQTYFVEVHLTQIRPRPTLTRLGPPTDLVDRDDLGRVATHLTYSRRGQPSYRLAPPTLIDLSPQVFYLRVETTRIKHPPVQSVLRRPTDTVGLEDQGRVAVHLAYQSRGKAKPHLGLPVVIDLSPQVYTVNVTLARITPPPTISRLSPPTDTVAEKDQGRVAVHLAASRRPLTRSRLAPPTAIDLRPQVVILSTNLTYSVRGKPKSRLAPPTVVNAFDTLARPTQRWLVAVPRLAQPRTPWSGLRAPRLVFDTVRFFGPKVTLVRGRSGVAKPRLSPPPVVGRTPQTVYLSVNLTYSRRGRPRSRLAPPTVVAVAQRFRPTSVWLADSRRGRTLTHLTAPVFGRVYAPITVTLAPSRRGTASHVLRPPAVVGRAPVGETRVTLARTVTGRTLYLLRPPVVIDTRPQTVYLAVTLTYSRRGTPRYFTTVPIAVAFAPSHGDVCGSDSTDVRVCGTDSAASNVCGDEQQVGRVEGATDTETRLQGTDSGEARVSGSDSQAT